MSHRILVIDSEHGIRELLDIALELDGHDVVLASSEYEALVCLTSEPPIDAIILGDLEPVPQASQSLLLDLHHDPAFKPLPVLVLSTQVASEDRQRAFDQGATAWLSKPFAITQIIDTVRTLFTSNAAV